MQITVFDASHAGSIARAVDAPMVLAMPGPDGLAQMNMGGVATIDVSLAELRQWHAEIEGALDAIDAEFGS